MSVRSSTAWREFISLHEAEAMQAGAGSAMATLGYERYVLE